LYAGDPPAVPGLAPVVGVPDRPTLAPAEIAATLARHSLSALDLAFGECGWSAWERDEEVEEPRRRYAGREGRGVRGKSTVVLSGRLGRDTVGVIIAILGPERVDEPKEEGVFWAGAKLDGCLLC
jgi:hypothetical protein